MIVMDCSAAIEIVRKTKLGTDFMALMGTREEVLAPKLFVCEVTNVIFKYVKAGMLSREKAPAYQHEALDIVDRYVDDFELQREVLRESIHLNHSAYDMFYFVLARRNNATLFTADKWLAKLCAEQGVSCVMRLLDDAYVVRASVEEGPGYVLN